MAFNIHKYDNTKFSSNPLTDKRVIALLLWFEYEVDKNNLSLDEQIRLMSRWLDKLLEEEYYEVLPFLKKKLNDMIKLRIDDKQSEKLENTKKESFLIRVWSKVKSIRFIFKKK